MADSSSGSYDAVIIGAGHNGLTAALLLQRAGLRTVLLEAKRYAGDRKSFGVAIDQHQAVQLRLAEMATKLVAARLMTAEAANESSGSSKK